jgi:signal transduction histidine kinase
VAVPHIPWWLLALVFTVTELEGRGLVRNRRVLGASTSRIPLIVGLYLATPVGLVVGQALGVAAASIPRWRTSPKEAVYALTSSVLATTFGIWAYLLMTDRLAPRGPEGWIDGMVAGAVVITVSATLGTVALGPGHRSPGAVRPAIGRSLLTDMFAVATGLVAAEIIRTDRHAVWLLVLPAFAAHVIRRQYELTDWRADALGTLHDVARDLQRASDHREATALAVEQARMICHAGAAQIVLRTGLGTTICCTDHGSGSSFQDNQVIETEELRLITGLDARSGAVVLSDGGPPAERRRGSGRRERQTVIVPIAEHGSVTGYLQLRDRVGRVAFTHLEIGVLETLAASLGVALETIQHLDELVDRQRRDAEVVERLGQGNRELNRVSNAKSIFLATTSHELRAPLTALLAETEILDHLLPQVPGEDRCRHLVDGARSNARHLLRLVDDLLDLSRIEAERLELRQAPVDLAELVADAVSALRPVIAEKQLSLTLGEVRCPALIRGDPDRLWQVIANLVTNAGNATPPGGHIRVDVVTSEGRLRLQVSDTGVGIPSDELERMFVPFEQGPDRSRGLGLGLTIARHLVEAHGGTLKATSVPGEGSCFTASFDAPMMAETLELSVSPASDADGLLQDLRLHPQP